MNMPLFKGNTVDLVEVEEAQGGRFLLCTKRKRHLHILHG